jgi:hypothetical protein
MIFRICADERWNADSYDLQDSLDRTQIIMIFRIYADLHWLSGGAIEHRLLGSLGFTLICTGLAEER